LCGIIKGWTSAYGSFSLLKEISIGDYVLSGGELGALVLSDALIRLIPVLSDENLSIDRQLSDGLPSGPIYTRPQTIGRWSSLSLTSGNFAKIEVARRYGLILKTRRPTY
jgi:tRNA (guanine37-N1)-methyltransferase